MSSMSEAADLDFMNRALLLAGRGLFTTTPNPRVGCVLVRDGVVVGEGWHERAGEAHAEVVALRAAGASARGATAYVNLEPCSHFGRTPPCADALIAAGVRRVVVATPDPHPRVAGSGLDKLRRAGVIVDTGLLGERARELNVGFFHRVQQGKPWVRLKIAATLDGKTALNNGKSRWITGAEARRDGHAWRARACTVLTGIGTVKDDDPQLTVREVDTTRQPRRLVVDSRLDIDPRAKVLEGGGVLIAAAVDHADKRRRLEGLGAEILLLPNAAGKVDLAGLMRELGRREMNEVHIEAGYKLNGSLLRERIVDEFLIYLAPTIVGDDALGMFHLPQLSDLALAYRLDVRDFSRIGSDYRILARPGVRDV